MFTEEIGIKTGTVNVVTTDNKGLDSDHWADRATNHIISVSQDAPPAIRDQAAYDYLWYIVPTGT